MIYKSSILINNNMTDFQLFPLLLDMNKNKMHETREFYYKGSTNKKTASQVLNMAFMNFLVLWVLYNEPHTRNFASQYAQKTIRYNHFKNYYMTETDLYILLNIIQNGDRTKVRSGNFIAIKLKVIYIRNLLKLMASNQHISEPLFRSTILKIRNNLGISDSYLKTIERNVIGWKRLGNDQQTAISTRIKQFYLENGRRSDLYVKFIAMRNNRGKGNIGNMVAKVAGVATGYAAGKHLAKKII